MNARASKQSKALSLGKLPLAGEIARALLIVGGGYALTVCCTAILTLALIAFGLGNTDSVLASVISAFLLYVCALIWGFQERRWLRLTLIFVAAPAALFSVAYFATPGLPAS